MSEARRADGASDTCGEKALLAGALLKSSSDQWEEIPASFYLKEPKCCPHPNAHWKQGLSHEPCFSTFPRDAIEKHACFRQMCTSFFVDLVSTMCFRDSSPPQKDVVEALLSLLFIQKRFLDSSQSELLSPAGRLPRSLSPFARPQ